MSAPLPKSNPTARIQIELSAQKYAEFEQLLKDCGFETKKDFFNNVMTLLKWAVRHVKEGHSVAAVDDGNKRYFELQMPFLEHVASTAAEKVREG